MSQIDPAALTRRYDLTSDPGAIAAFLNLSRAMSTALAHNVASMTEIKAFVAILWRDPLRTVRIAASAIPVLREFLLKPPGVRIRWPPGTGSVPQYRFFLFCVLSAQRYYPPGTWARALEASLPPGAPLPLTTPARRTAFTTYSTVGARLVAEEPAAPAPRCVALQQVSPVHASLVPRRVAPLDLLTPAPDLGRVRGRIRGVLARARREGRQMYLVSRRGERTYSWEPVWEVIREAPGKVRKFEMREGRGENGEEDSGQDGDSQATARGSEVDSQETMGGQEVATSTQATEWDSEAMQMD